MTSPHDLSRRAFIGGAASVGALSAATALGAPASTHADQMPFAVAGDDLSAQALPPIIPGARVGTVGISDMSALSNDGSAGRGFAASGVFSATGLLIAPLEMPVGSRLLRADFYFAVTSATASFSFAIVSSGFAGVSTVANLVTVTPMAAGVVQGIYAPSSPNVVAAGQRLHLQASNCGSSARMWRGAVYQYFDANPQLNLLATPIRVYDSRPGATPTTVVKGPLANDATRVIDCTLGGAVPVGAAAALITLTLVGTSTAGYMALWQNGIADPGTSSINWDHTGTNVAVTTVVAVDTAARLIAKTGPNASADFIIDVIGFYA